MAQSMKRFNASAGANYCAMGSDGGPVSPLSDEFVDATIGSQNVPTSRYAFVGDDTDVEDDAQSTLSTSIEGGKGRTQAYGNRYGYRSSCDVVRRYMGCDHASLTKRERHIVRTHTARIRRHECANPGTVRLSDGIVCHLAAGDTPGTPDTIGSPEVNSVTTTTNVESHGPRTVKFSSRKPQGVEEAIRAQTSVFGEPDSRIVRNNGYIQAQGCGIDVTCETRFEPVGKSDNLNQQKSWNSEILTAEYQEHKNRLGSATLKNEFHVKNVVSSTEARSSKHRKTTRWGTSPQKQPCQTSVETSEPVAPMVLPIGVLLRGFPKSKLSPSQMKTIEEAIVDKVLLAMEIKPQFYGTTYDDGYLVMHCCNNATSEWIKKIIPSMMADMWATEEAKVPYPKVVVGQFLTAANLPTEVILDNIKLQNSHLNVDLWRVIDRKNNDTVARLALSIDRISAEQLENTQNRISFRLLQVILHFVEGGVWNTVMNF